MAEAKLLQEQADQLRTRMQARVPIKGSLSFLDSRGTPHAMGIDVGQEQSMQEPRSHIEGATPSAAIWSFGIVPDPFTPPGRQPRIARPAHPGRRLPAAGTRSSGTSTGVYELRAQIDADQRGQGSSPTCRPPEPAELDAAIARNQQELDRIRAEYDARRSAGRRARGSRPPTPRPPASRRRPTRLRERGRRAALAADHRRDDLQRLPDDQGEDRRAGLRRDRGDQPRTPAPSSRATSSRSRSTTPTGAAPAVDPGRARAARCGSRSAA